MRGVLLSLCGVLAAAAVGAEAAADEHRVALVIGNGAYTETAPLANPPNDANDMAETLERLGFEVISVVDGDKARMEQGIRDFGSRAGAAAVALFFYAGHGLEVAGSNYMVPTTAKLLEERDLEREAVGMDMPIGEMAGSGASVKIAIFDACRNNPLAINLARSMRASGRSAVVGNGLAELPRVEGMLIAYATAPGAIAADGGGRNSPFTAALLNWIEQPGLDVSRMFRRVRAEVVGQTDDRQWPWLRDALLGDFYFAGAAGLPVVPPPRLPMSPPSPEPELEPLEATYVAVKDASVREAPSVRSARIAVLPRGVDVYVAGKVKDANWYLVQLDDKRQGYVFGDLLTDITPSAPAMPTPALKAGETLPRDCAECPEMVVIPAGHFPMGSPGGEKGRVGDEGPRHRVTIPRAFALSKYEVTRAEFAAFARETGHVQSGCYVDDGSARRSRLQPHYRRNYARRASSSYQHRGTWKMNRKKSWRDPNFGQTDRDPVVCVNWDDAQDYVNWLSLKTGQEYRLPSESEWEYVARAGTTTARYWGNSPDLACRHGNIHDQTSKTETGHKSTLPCRDGYDTTAPVGSFGANNFGLHDVLGNVLEWVQDCYATSYERTPRDGSAWTGGDCGFRVLRGGSWNSAPSFTRAALRAKNLTEVRLNFVGLRVAKTLR